MFVLWIYADNEREWIAVSQEFESHNNHMRRLVFWLSLFIPALVVVCGIFCSWLPLGVPGEWTWDRVAPTEPLMLALGPLLVAAALYLGFVSLGAQRID